LCGEDTLASPRTHLAPVAGCPDGDRAIASPSESALESFGPIARDWFASRFEVPTPVQREGWPRIARGEHTLLIAPTGSGKTLAAFLSCIDRLARQPPGVSGVRVLYVSPLKALVYDIERNLRAPLGEMQRSAGQPGQDHGTPLPRVAVRTGDTTQRERRQQARDPAEILVTTPESLFLILGSRQRETLATVETIIVDEIHALAPTKRGAHLAISLERVAAAAQGDPQRIGLSATAQPLGEVARFLGGDRNVGIVDASMRPRLDLEISVPVPDMTRPEIPSEGAVSYVAAGASAGVPGDGVGTLGSRLPAAGRAGPESPVERGGLWPAIYPRLLEQILAHRSTILFVNSRGLCERLSQRLNELAGEDLTRAHHGSLAHERRSAIEESLKTGDLRAIVATSSLELGIDMGAVDLVLMVESPGSVARGLQRAGRAGHRVGAVSRARIFPKHRGDLLEATVVAHEMERGAVEPMRLPRNPLDVLAQQLVAMCAVAPAAPADLEALLHRTASYCELSREMLCAVLDMLAGRYPSTDFAELRPRIVWDRDADRIEARAGAGQLALVSGGTIPDRGLYAVHLGERGPRVGELDEEMVNETRPGEVITLGASSWRVEQITRDRVVVSPAPGEVGKLPFWRGDGPGRPIELGRAIGAFVRELARRCALGSGDAAAAESRVQAERWLRDHYRLDAWAARNLVDHVVTQREATGCLPTDRSVTVERFRDELGDWRICILTPFGARIHAPWALAIEALLSQDAGPTPCRRRSSPRCCPIQTTWRSGSSPSSSAPACSRRSSARTRRARCCSPGAARACGPLCGRSGCAPRTCWPLRGRSPPSPSCSRPSARACRTSSTCRISSRCCATCGRGASRWTRWRRARRHPSRAPWCSPTRPRICIRATPPWRSGAPRR
jgi:ATP-dependent Lhr-like helicase